MTHTELEQAIKNRVWLAINANKTGPYHERVLLDIQDSEKDAIMAAVDKYVREQRADAIKSYKKVETKLKAERRRAGLEGEK